MPSMGRAIGKVRVSFSMVGDVELKRKLDELPDRVFRKVIKKASNRAMSPVLKTAKARAPKETGLLRKSLGKKSKVYKRAGVQVTLVGPRTGFREEVMVEGPDGLMKDTRDPVKYAHLVEFGTAPHEIGAERQRYVYDYSKPKGSRKKKVDTKVNQYTHPGSPPHPFMRPAFDENKAAIESIFRQETAAGVIEEAKRA